VAVAPGPWLPFVANDLMRKIWINRPVTTDEERSDDRMVLDLFLQPGRTRQNEVRCLPNARMAREEPGEAARAVRDGQAKAIWS